MASFNRPIKYLDIGIHSNFKTPLQLKRIVLSWVVFFAIDDILWRNRAKVTIVMECYVAYHQINTWNLQYFAFIKLLKRYENITRFLISLSETVCILKWHNSFAAMKASFSIYAHFMHIVNAVGVYGPCTFTVTIFFYWHQLKFIDAISGSRQKFLSSVLPRNICGNHRLVSYAPNTVGRIEQLFKIKISNNASLASQGLYFFAWNSEM